MISELWAKCKSRIPSHILVATSAWASRGVTTLISLYSIRLLTEELGVQQYAVYSVLVSLMGWFMLADFGMGMSMQNFISASRARKNSYSEYIAITSLFVAIIGLCIFGLVYFFGNALGTALLNQFSFMSQSEKHANFITIATISLGVCFGSHIYRIWYAEQKGHWANLVPALAAFVGLASIYLVSKTQLEDKLFWYLIAGNVWFAVFPAVALISIVGRLVSLKVILQRAVFMELFKRALQFWLLTFLATAVLQIDYIIMSQFVEANEIAMYSIAMKLFAIGALLYGAVLQAFWPTCSEWVVSQEWDKIESFTTKYVVLMGIFMTMFTVAVVLFREQLLSLLMPAGGIDLPVSFAILMGVTFLVRAWTDIFAIILNSANDLRDVLWWGLIQAALNVSLQIFLAPRFGVYGITLGLLGSFLLTVSWALPRRVYKLKGSSTRRMDLRGF